MSFSWCGNQLSTLDGAQCVRANCELDCENLSFSARKEKREGIEDM